MTFKIGDKVEVVEKYDAHEVGKVGTITSISGHTNSYYRINGDKCGAPARKFKKVEDKPMFKIGDKVKILNNSHNPVHFYKIGSVVEVTGVRSNGDLMLKGNRETDGASNQTVNPKCVEKVNDLYEDDWILNDGKVTIPDDAQKSMHEGSVVAFRKRKVIPLVFGDELTSGSCTYKFIRYTDSKKDRVDIFNPDTNSLLTEIFLNLLNRK